MNFCGHCGDPLMTSDEHCQKCDMFTMVSPYPWFTVVTTSTSLPTTNLPTVPFPEEVFIHDMAQGPCKCGMFHRLSDWSDALRQKYGFGASA